MSVHALPALPARPVRKAAADVSAVTVKSAGYEENPNCPRLTKGDYTDVSVVSRRLLYDGVVAIPTTRKSSQGRILRPKRLTAVSDVATIASKRKRKFQHPD